LEISGALVDPSPRLRCCHAFAGTITHARILRIGKFVRAVGAAFTSTLTPNIFGVAASELVDQIVPLENLWPPAEVERFHESLRCLEQGPIAEPPPVNAIPVTRPKDKADDGSLPVFLHSAVRQDLQVSPEKKKHEILARVTAIKTRERAMEYLQEVQKKVRAQKTAPQNR
jgi:hypothetical protein